MTKRLLLMLLILLLALSGCANEEGGSLPELSEELSAPEGPPVPPEADLSQEEAEEEQPPLRRLEISPEDAAAMLKGEGEVWEISTAEELCAFSVLVNSLDTEAMAAQVELTADLVLSGIDFVPIGEGGVGFIGTFQGNGHIINGLTIDSEQDGVGLFGTLGMGATVADLHLIGAQVRGGNQVGGIAGNSTGTILRCSVRGKVEGTGQSVGGIAGLLKGDPPAEEDSGTLLLAGGIEQCAANVEVTGHAHVGGLAGDVSGTATVADSYALGTVTSIKGTGSDTPNSIGGLCGAVSGTVVRCYASAEVYTRENSRIVGGFVGLVDSGRIQDCYFNKTPVENWKDVGYVIAGEAESGEEPGEAPGEAPEPEAAGESAAAAEEGTHSGITACTVEEITHQATFVGWDFAQVWDIAEGQNRGLPFLRAISG